MVWTGTPAGLCQQIPVDKPPPLSSLSPHGHRKRRPGGFHPALTLLIRLSVEPVCGRGPRKQLGARGRISWGSCWGRAWGGQGSDLRGGFHPAPPGICAERHRRPPPPGRGLQERPRCVRAAPWHSSRHGQARAVTCNQGVSPLVSLLAGPFCRCWCTRWTLCSQPHCGAGV